MFTLLEEECHAMDMVAAQESTDQDFSCASDPFKQYHAMIQQLSALISTKEDAQANADKIDQVYTLLSVQYEDSPQVELLKNSAIHYHRLMAEVVSTL